MPRGGSSYDEPLRKFVVLGGVGVIGRIVVRDLLETHRGNQVLIADFNLAKADRYARRLRSRRVTAAFADAANPSVMAAVFQGATVVINCTQHDFNLNVMEAALAARVHYLDLGGLFHWTRKQLKLDPRFQTVGRTAIIGMGCSPGITNVMARQAADQFERINAVNVRIATASRHTEPEAFYFPYSAQTIVEELTLEPWVFQRDKFCKVAPRTGWELMQFPNPIGAVWLVRTRHSEVATLPLELKSKGIQFCDFKVCLNRGFVREVMRHLRDGWTIKQLAALPAPTSIPNDYEIARVIVSGAMQRGGKRVPAVVTIDCHARARHDWKASAGDVDTGCPASIVAQMIADGSISERGVLPPERVVPAEPFFKELLKRGMIVRQQVTLS